MTTLRKVESVGPSAQPSGETLVRRSNEGQALWFLGGLYEIKSTSKETNGEMSLVRATLPPGATAPPHTHDCGEAIFVLEGSVRVYRGEDQAATDLGAGDLVYFPKGTLECAENVSNDLSRVLLIYAPGGMDEFFAEAGRKAEVRDVPPFAEEYLDLESLSEIAARHGLERRPKATD